MRMMIASDLHGSAYYTEKVRELFERHRPEKLILLGDLLYHGPRNPLPRDYDPRKAAAILNGMKDKIMAVRGNCDCEVDQMVLDFPILADYMLWYADGRVVFATHGHLYDGRPPALGPDDIFLQGHTHVPVIASTGPRLRLNPGSVSLPKSGSAPSYMMYEDAVFSIRRLDDVEIMRLDLRVR